MTKIQTSSRPDDIWPEVWSKMYKNSQREETAMGKKKNKMDATRQFQENVLHWTRSSTQQENWKRIKKIAMPYGAQRISQKTTLNNTSRGEPCPEAQPEESSCTKDEKSSGNYALKIDAYESQRCRINERGKPKHVEDSATLGHNFMSLYNLVHLLTPFPKAMKIPKAEAAVVKEWETSKNLPAWPKSKVTNEQEGIEKTQKESKTIHFATLLYLRHLQNFKIGQEILKKYKGRVVLRGNAMKDDSGSYVVFREQVSSAMQIQQRKYQMKFRDCQVAQAKQATLCQHTLL